MLVPAGLDKSVGLLTMQYYKDPNDPQWKDDPAMLEWRGFMGRYYSEGDPKDASNLYAYLTAQIDGADPEAVRQRPDAART